MLPLDVERLREDLRTLGGRGRAAAEVRLRARRLFHIPCETCGGRGFLPTAPCGPCRGLGRVSVSREAQAAYLEKAAAEARHAARQAYREARVRFEAVGVPRERFELLVRSRLPADPKPCDWARAVAELAAEWGI
jgi:hypothetical protein